MLLKIYFLNCELTTIVLVRCVVCCGTTLDKPCWPFDMSCQEDYFNLHFLLLFDTFSMYFLCQYSSGDLTCSFHALHECCYSLSFLRILSWTKSVRPFIFPIFLKVMFLWVGVYRLWMSEYCWMRGAPPADQWPRSLKQQICPEL